MSERRPVVYYSLKTQFENLGDCIINELVIRELARHAPVKIIQRRAPTWLLDRLKNDSQIQIYASKGRWFTDLFRRLLQRAPVVFAFKPGHYLTRSTVKSLGYSTALIGFCGVCRIRGAKIIRSGVSLDRFGPLQSRLQAVLGKLHTSYGVRDNASLEYARRLGASSAHYSPDMAFLLTPPHGSVLASDEPVTEHHRGIGNRLSISFRKQGSLIDPAQQTALISAIMTIAQQHHLPPAVVEQVTFDRELAQSLADQLGCDVIRFDQSEASVCAIFKNYARSRLVISNRLHSLLFGWTAGAIPIPLIDNTPHSKILSLFQHLGLERLIIYNDQVARLPQHVAALLEDEGQLRNQLSQIYIEQRSMLKAALAGCFDEPQHV